jgi:signal transduction histidine kinase
MTFQVETNSIIQFLIAFVALLNVFILWRYKSSPGVFFLILLDFFVSFWAITYAFEFATPVLSEKIFWSQISYVGISFTPLSYFLFTTGFSQRSHLLTRNNIILLAIFPAITGVLALTNGCHHWVWTNVTLDPGVNIAHYDHGFVFWIYWTYSILLIIGGLFNLVSSIYQFPEFYKSQVYTLLIGSFFPVLGNIMYVTDLNPFPGFDWTPALFAVSGFIITFGVTRFRMFELVPIAKNKLPDIINQAIIICSIEGIIEYFNKAACLLPEQSGQLENGRFIHRIFPTYKSILDKLGSRDESKTEHITNEEPVQIFQITITPLFIENKLSGHLLIFHDITLLKEAGIKLEEQNSRLLREIESKEKLIADLDAFAHTVAHDIKSPVGSIISALSLADEYIQTKDIDMLAELMDMIRISANKSMHITNELLMLASVRKQEVQRTRLDMGAIYKEAQNRLNSIIKENGATVTAPENWPDVLGYAGWVEEIWVNYISNAIKYGGNPPMVVTGFDQPMNGFVRLWVKDNGDGVLPENQALLFNQFTRLSPAMGHGHGLGLSIVKRITDELGGISGVESSGIKGEGSLFYFTLPIE